jgi:tetratricopeptide (TPR) repeat protein
VTEALAIARAIGWRSGEIIGSVLYGALLAFAGEFDRALAVVENGFTIAREIGHSEWIANTYSMRSAILAQLFAWDQVIDNLEQALEATRISASAIFFQLNTGALAAAYTLRGRLEDAERVFETVEPGLPMRTIGQRTIWEARAIFALERHDPESAMEILDRLFATAPNFQGEASLSNLAYWRAQALLRLGRVEDAIELLYATRQEAVTINHRSLQWRIEALLAVLYGIQDRPGDAAEAAARAWSIVEQITGNVSDPTLRTGFLAGARALIPGDPPAWAGRSAADTADPRPGTS